MNAFQKLKTILNSVSGKSIVDESVFSIETHLTVHSDLQDIDSNTFLTPFLDIIRSDETSGPITCLALNSVNKFLSYGLIGSYSNVSFSFHATECLTSLDRHSR